MCTQVAPASDIKPEAYTPDHVLALFRAFQEVCRGAGAVFTLSCSCSHLRLCHEQGWA